MYLEDMTGKGQYMLTLVDENGEKYQGESDTMNFNEEIIYYKLKKEE